MYAPPCSWRTGTKSIDESASDSFRSSVSSPGMPKTCLTPSASRHSTNTSEALRGAMSRTLPGLTWFEPDATRRAHIRTAGGPGGRAAGPRLHDPRPRVRARRRHEPVGRVRLRQARPRLPLDPAPLLPRHRTPGRTRALDPGPAPGGPGVDLV